MKKLPKRPIFFVSQSAATLLEILIVLSITGVMLGIVVYGVVKFRQTLIVSNAANELVVQMRKARRYAIDNVVTSEGYATRGYYIYLYDNDYRWGECTDLGCEANMSLKSAGFGGVDVSRCRDTVTGEAYPIVKFNYVTGEFVISDLAEEVTATPNITCEIEVKLGGGIVNTGRKIEVSGSSRTVKLIM